MKGGFSLKINENNFIHELNNQNEKAMNYLIDEYGWILKTVISRNLSLLPNLKDECLNDCLMAIWENIGYYNPEKSSFKNWIGAIAKYKCIDYKRKYLKELSNVNIDDLDLESSVKVDENLLKEETKKEIEAMLGTLGELDKNIFTKFYFEDKKATQISDELELSEDAVYKRLSRARAKLKSKFAHREEDKNA